MSILSGLAGLLILCCFYPKLRLITFLVFLLLVGLLNPDFGWTVVKLFTAIIIVSIVVNLCINHGNGTNKKYPNKNEFELSVVDE
jgi:uncharacterized membrane protein YhaH (DUF805 family)